MVSPYGKSQRQLPKLPNGGPRCPTCKYAAPLAGQHHVCRDGKCTTCKGGAAA